MIFKLLHCIAIWGLGFVSIAQTLPETPQMKPFEASPIGNSSRYKAQSKPQGTSNTYQSPLQSKNAEEVKQSVKSYDEPSQVFHSLNKGNFTLNSKSNIPSKSHQTISYVESLLNEVKGGDFKIKSTYSLPSLSRSDAVHFENAFSEISNMLEGKTPLNLKRAIYLTENAWYGGQMKYNDFTGLIDDAAYLINAKMTQEGLSLKDEQAINFMTHQYISDTLTINLKSQEKRITTFPKKYDFDDPFGKDDASKLFVSKLMIQNSGQCKSLPLLFIALVETLGGNAYLSFSPSHSFVICKDKYGKLYNIELTNGMLTTNSWIVSSGYVKSEAIKSGIFLDTLNKKQIIANCLVDLAQNYRWKFGSSNTQMGYDDFNLKCINKALKYHPTNINAILEKSNYYSVLFNYVAYLKGCKSEEDCSKYTQANEILQQRNKLYALTDGLGYEPMPEKAYKDWLQTLEEKQHQQEHEKEYTGFSKISISY